MYRSVSLLSTCMLCVFSASQIPPQCRYDFDIPITGESLKSLNTSVWDALDGLLREEFYKLNSTYHRLNIACVGHIETKQAECIQCIDNNCNARLDALACTDIPASAKSLSPSGSFESRCGLVPSLCDITSVVDKAKISVEIAGKIVKQISQKAVKHIKKVAKKVLGKIGSGLKTAGKSITKVTVGVGKDIAKTTKKIVSKVAKATHELSKKIASKVKNAAKKVVNVAKKGINAVKKVFKKWGRRRRQVSTVGPTCETFKTDANACLYYHSQCASCSGFDLGIENQPTAEELFKRICSEADLNNYKLLINLSLRINEIVDAFQTDFNLYAAKYDPLSYLSSDNTFQCVQIDFQTMFRNITLDTSPINPHEYKTAGTIIAQDIFHYVFLN